MGRHLGRLGKARAARTDTFDYFDLEGVRVHPDLTDLLLFDFMLKADAIDESDEKAAMAATRGLFESLVHPEDFAAFWAASLTNRQTVTDLMATVSTLIEGLTDRPTVRRSDSSRGRRKTERKSRGGSSSRVIRRLEIAGRPDLALVALQAEEQRAG
jgi:hypothetical protein